MSLKYRTLSVYTASSWQNERYPDVVRRIKDAGFSVCDFRSPETAFNWCQVDPTWDKAPQIMDPVQIVKMLNHPLASRGFQSDWRGMLEADVCALILPSGSSAHADAGYMKGMGKKLFVLLDNGRPELAYRLADALCIDVGELIENLKAAYEEKAERTAGRLVIGR